MTIQYPSAQLASHDESTILVLEAINWEFPGVDDYWDGNWILFKVTLVKQGLSVEFTDPCIRTDELENFSEDLKNLARGYTLRVESDFSEPVLYFDFILPDAGSDIVLGRIEIHLDDGEGTNDIAVELELDVDSIEHFSSGLEGILRQYPVVARETH
jgi:hypothetical protein